MDDDADNPYRVAGQSRLGRTLATFSTPRRPRYAGSGRVASRPGLMGPGTQTGLHWTRRKPSESVELCERGLRMRVRAGLLELTWDQIVGWDRVEQGGSLLGIDLRGSHGEEVHLDRNLRGLDDLYAAVAARRR